MSACMIPVSKHTIRAFAISVAFVAAAAGDALAQDEPATIADLAWIAGEWSVVMGDQTIQEHWMQPAANALLGMGRTLADDRMVAFEYLRIEARADTLYYVAQPNGRPPTSFKLTRWDGTTAVFENPAHDFPKRVLYTRLNDDTVTAQVDGGEGTDALKFTYSRIRD